MLNKEVISRIKNSLRFNTKDDHISGRYILSVARAKARTLISQKLLDRTILREDNLFKTIKCLKLKSIDIVKCGIYEFEKCNSLMKSEKKIPEMLYSRYGNSILEVVSVDGSTVFLPITLQSYNMLKKRMVRKNKKLYYYYVNDGYLYIPDSEIEYVDVTLLTLEGDEVDKLSNCGKDGSTSCKSKLDNEFICPDKLLDFVLSDTLKEVSMTRQIPVDENPDLNLNNKTSPPQN